MFRRRGRAKRENTAALEGAVREAVRAVDHVPTLGQLTGSARATDPGHSTGQWAERQLLGS
eukprot:12571951-Alexandrium_andersonii.AAC.1